MSKVIVRCIQTLDFFGRKLCQKMSVSKVMSKERPTFSLLFAWMLLVRKTSKLLLPFYLLIRRQNLPLLQTSILKPKIQQKILHIRKGIRLKPHSLWCRHLNPDSSKQPKKTSNYQIVSGTTGLITSIAVFHVPATIVEEDLISLPPISAPSSKPWLFEFFKTR